MSSLTQRKLRPVTNSPDAFLSSGGPSPYLAGEVIGDRYRLEHEIGRGGMGVVWVAHSLVLGVDVAVKLIHAETAGPSLATRMSREAYAAARLGHPALVRVFDFGWTNRGDPFLVMEFVQGETLASKVRRDGPMPAIRAVQTLLPIADGLRLAHERGIVHRDIKPDNILLATDALGRVQPKLLDFGIAKVDQAPVNGKLTQMGAVLGSPEYMSPEQAQGLEAVDARTDVWSLSIALYELLTGDVPFVGSNYNALMQAIINDPAPPPRAGDAELWSVLSKGLAKSPEDRWSSMSEFGEALARWLYDHGVKEDLSGNSVRAVWLERPTGPWTAITNPEPVQRRSSRPFAETQERLKIQKPWQKPKVRWALGVAVVAITVFAVLEWGFNDRPAESVAEVAEPPTEPVLEPPTLTPLPAADDLAVKQVVESPPSSARGSAPPPSSAEPPATKRNPNRVQPKPKKPRHDFGF
jgi:serine/threonine protein kinase